MAVPAGASVPLPAEAPAFQSAPTVAGCFTALVSVMWAYDGWADLSALSGEVREPSRSLPRALVAGAVADVDRTALFAFGVVLAGLPVRALWARWRATAPGP